MAKILTPKCKLCRRAGEKLFLKGERCKTAKCGVLRRNYAPGAHGPKHRPRMTAYGLQLAEKQKARRQYNLMEKQFRASFDKAKRKPGNVGENFLQILETRLDNVVFRSGFAETRSQARQMVNHGLFTVNGRAVNIPSFHVKTGDVLKIKANKKKAKVFTDIGNKLKNKEVPGWINLEAKEASAKVLHLPAMADISPNFNLQMIVEYYSR